MTELPRPLVASVLVLTLVVYGEMIVRVHRLGAEQRAAGGERWWYSTSIDLVNLTAVALSALGHWALGLSGPHAVLCGMVSVLLVYGAEYVLRRRGLAGLVRMLLLGSVGILVALPGVLAPEILTGGLRSLQQALYD